MNEKRHIDAIDRPAAQNGVWVLAAAILGSTMGFLDGAVLHVALPAIRSDLGATLAGLQWVLNGYLLALAALVVVGGALGDRIGRRRAFVWGVAGFAVSSIACAVAPDAPLLIAARVLQGVAAALLIPQSLAMIAAAYPPETRGWAVGVWASASAVATAFGPPLGGFLVDSLGWRWVFWINLPIAVAAIGLAARSGQDSGAPDTGRQKGPIDWAGAATCAGALGLASWAMIAAPDRGFDLWVLAAAAAAVVGFAAFAWIETHAQNPIAPPALFANQTVLFANAVTFMLWGALGGALFLIPLDLIAGRGLSAAWTGWAMVPFAAMIALGAPLGGKLGDRFGPRAMLTAGPALFAVVCLGLIAAPSDAVGLVWVLAALPCLGLAMAASIAPVTAAAVTSAPESVVGSASGVNNAVSRAGGLIAVAGAGAVAGLAFRLAGGATGDFAAALASGSSAAQTGLRAGYAACAMAAATACLLARGLPAKR